MVTNKMTINELNKLVKQVIKENAPMTLKPDGDKESASFSLDTDGMTIKQGNNIIKLSSRQWYTVTKSYRKYDWHTDKN